jgi:hypothetical protein
MGEASDQLHEGVLNEVLGEIGIPGKNAGQPVRGASMLLVQLRQRPEVGVHPDLRPPRGHHSLGFAPYCRDAWLGSLAPVLAGIFGWGRRSSRRRLEGSPSLVLALDEVAAQSKRPRIRCGLRDRVRKRGSTRNYRGASDRNGHSVRRCPRRERSVWCGVASASWLSPVGAVGGR